MNTVKRIISSVLALSLITGAYTPVISSASYYDNSIQSMAESSKSYDDIVIEIREHFIKRDTEFTLEIPEELFSGFDDLRNMIADACNETDNPVGGDYLRWTAGKISYGASFTGSTAVITVNVSYRTTAEQEAELDEKVAEILASLDFGSGSDYDKAKAVYDYVAENVSYNVNGSDMKFSAYGAGIQGEAVCEGYSLLLYRLLMETGIKCRVLLGDADGPHAWNMAEIDGVYYFMDVTFDSTRTSNDHNYFLKGSNDFDKTHTFDVSDLIAVNSPYYYDYYKDGDFLSRFNISETAYDPLNPPATTSKTTTATSTTADTAETTTTTVTTGIIDDSSIYLLNNNPSVGMVGQKVFLFWRIDGYSNKELYSLTSDNENVAIANAKDGITLVGEGTAEIEIVFKAESDGNTYYATKYLTVQAVPYVETTTVSTVTTIKLSVTTKKTTTTTTTETTALKYEVTLLGDANCDGRLTIADATAIIQALGNHDEYALSAQGEKNADCFNTGDGVTGRDALSIQKLEAGLIDSLPEIEE